MPEDLFLSYSSHDRNIAEKLKQRLVDADFHSLWFDQQRIEPGHDWRQQLALHSEGARPVLVVLTPRWKNSWWTRFEVYGAEHVFLLHADGGFDDCITPPARVILRLAAFMADTPIPMALFKANIPRIRVLAAEFPSPAGYAAVPGDDLLLRDAAIDLKRYSLASGEGTSLGFHNLLQAVEHLTLPDADRLRWWYDSLAAFIAHAPSQAWKFEHWPAWKLLVEHARKLHAHWPSFPGVGPRTELVLELSNFLASQGHYAEAIPLARIALDEDEKELGPEHPDTILSVHNLAVLLESQVDTAGALPLYERALEAQERVLGPEHPTTLDAMHQVAFALQQKGDLAQAESAYRRLLELRERILGPDQSGK